MFGLLGRYATGPVVRRLRQKVIPNLVPLMTRSTVRRCGCCDQVSLFLQFGDEAVLQRCMRCAANFRYEALGRHLRARHPLSRLDILELDPGSSLQALLEQGKTYIRSYFKHGDAPGSRRKDGAVMEDITGLTLADQSVDLIVSSDVLEHVPDAAAAFAETWRVLRPGGVHVFTIPNQPETKRLAELVGGEVHHLVEPPEYHSDPLDPKGILAFWHYGPDLQEQFGASGLTFTRFTMTDHPDGIYHIWEARREATAP